MAHVFGLTGGIGSGKSTVANVFRSLGVPVVDADELSRAVVQKGTPGLALLENAFGSDILTSEGELDRSGLGARVFRSESDRQLLNAIVHPLVRRAAEAEFARLGSAGADLIGYDVPLLFETGQEERLRPIVVVSVPEPAQLARIVRRDGISEEEAELRISAQLPLSEKAARADHVIDNSGTPEETKEQAREVLARIRKNLSSPNAGQ